MSKHFLREIWGAFAEGWNEVDSTSEGNTAEPLEETEIDYKGEAPLLEEHSQSRQDQKPESAPATLYEYSPLASSDGVTKNIRLLTICPGRKHDEISCQIKHHCLTDCPSYEALSYVWGEPGRTKRIRLEDCSVNITENLNSALFHLRHESQPRVLWVDAICIDQKNNVERGEQVGFMQSIYQRAAQTIVWLGPASVESNLAITSLMKAAKQADEAGSSAYEGGAEPQKVDYKLKANYSPKTITEDASKAIDKLLGRPWFTRVWVIQEVAVAKRATIACGKSEIDWEVFNKGIQIGIARNELGRLVELGLMHDNEYQQFEAISTIAMKDKLRPPAEDLLYLLTRFRFWHASDPRDKVFALLGLVNDGVETLGIRPEYTASADDIYKRAATTILTKSQNLDILGACLANLTSDRGKFLPTWAPDWSSTDPDENIARAFTIDENDQPKNWTASKNTLAVPEFSSGGNVLGLSGHILDKIVEIGDFLSGLGDIDTDEEPGDSSSIQSSDNDSAMADFRAAGRQFKDVFADIGVIYGDFMKIAAQLEVFIKWEKIAGVRKKGHGPTGEDHMAVYWQTLCAGCMPDGYQKTEEYFKEWYKSLAPVRRLSQLGIGHLPRISQPLGLAGYLTSTFEQYSAFGALYKHALHRRLARTEKGYLCLVPVAAKVGHSIALFNGGKVPLTIAPAENGLWKLIGECYVHGIMRGEAFEEKYCETMRFI